MKKTIFRLSALLLVMVMLLTLLVGCKDPDATPDTDVDLDDSTVTDPIQITTTIYEIAKHGNLILYMYGSDLFEKGFEHGDVVEIAVAGKTWEAPLCTNYNDVDNGAVVLRASSETDGVVLAINMGDFATTAGIAQKTVIDEEPGYRWDYQIETPVELTITMKEKGGYREEWLIRQLVRTNERADYPHLSDEEFANFREIHTTGIGAGILYRSSSPIKPELGRSTYADKAAENAGIATIVNLADASNTYEGTESSYYNTCQVVYVNLGTDFLSEANLNGVAEGMRFIINNNGPYLIHCNEGKDRAGFVSALLECLMGATLDEVIDDYMLTYYNYYGVEKGSEKYDAVVNSNLIKALNASFKVDDIYTADLVSEAEAYLTEDVGLTADEVATLKAKLTMTLQDVYDSGKNLSALRGEHENVYVCFTRNGTLLSKEYLDKQSAYSFFAKVVFGTDYANYATDHSQYVCKDGEYAYIVTLTPSGMVDPAERLAEMEIGSFVASEILTDDGVTMIEKDGFIIVSCAVDANELLIMGEGVVSFVDTYTLDAKTRELISIKSVYTYEDGTVDESIVTITRDIEIPESVKPFLAYDQAEDLRTVTIVSNPGTADEKTDVIRTPKGLLVSLTLAWDVEKTVTVYNDVACTEPATQAPDTNADVTIYLKWE